MEGIMFARFTDRARRAMTLAVREAQRLDADRVGTEHILLGLVEEGGGVAANVLRARGIGLEVVRAEVEKRLKPGPGAPPRGRLPLAVQSERALESSEEESRNLGHHHVGTEHLLLGLLAGQGTLAAQVLLGLDLRLDDLRREVVDFLSREDGPPWDSTCPDLPS